MDPDLLRRILNLIFAVGQLMLPPLLFASGFESGAARTPIEATPNPATPAGYAFAVWGVIYVGALAYSIYQALPANAADPLLRRIGWLTAAGFALCCAWLVAARFGPIWLTVPIIVGMALCLGTALVISARWPAELSVASRLLIVAPLAVYVGWLSAATFVNAADVLPGYDTQGIGPAADVLGILVVALAAAVSLALSAVIGGNLFYSVTVLWALAAIVVRNAQSGPGGPELGIVAWSAIVAIGLLLLATVLTERQRPPILP
jgi:hypothetical protein